MKATITERLNEILISNGIPDSKIAPNADLKNDLSMDSLDKAELLIRIEQEFNISIMKSEWQSLTTYSNVVELIHRKINL